MGNGKCEIVTTAEGDWAVFFDLDQGSGVSVSLSAILGFEYTDAGDWVVILEGRNDVWVDEETAERIMAARLGSGKRAKEMMAMMKRMTEGGGE